MINKNNKNYLGAMTHCVPICVILTVVGCSVVVLVLVVIVGQVAVAVVVES